MQAISLGKLAKLVAGELIGDPKALIYAVASIDRAGPYHATFAQDLRTLLLHKNLRAGVVLAPQDAPKLSCNLIRVPHPRLAWNKVLSFFAPRVNLPEGIHPSASVSSTAHLEPGVTVGPSVVICSEARVGAGTVLYPGVYLGPRSTVGRDCLLYPNVVIREDVELGERVVLGPGTVVGGDGFEFVTVDGKHHKVSQKGRVVIEDDVELEALVTVDRAGEGATIVRQGSKSANLVQIAAGADVGEGSLLVSFVEIGPEAKLGRQVIMAGQSSIAAGKEIGEQSIVMARGQVISNLAAAAQVSGVPARPHAEELRSRAASLRLSGELARLRSLEKRIQQLEAVLIAKQKGGG